MASPDPTPSLEELKAEIKRVEAKLLASDDPDISGALELKLKSLREVAGQLKAAEPDPAPEEPPRKLTEAEQQEVDRLIRLAHAEKVKGNRARSKELLEQAQRLAPGSMPVLEAIADEFIAAKRWSEAKKVLEHARRLDPKNVPIEKKYADVVFAVAAAGSIDDQLRTALSDPNSIAPHEVMAKGWAASFLSFFLPGSGLFVLGKAKAGITTFCVWIAMLVWIGLERHDLQGLLGMMGVPSDVRRPTNLTVLVPIFAAAGIHLFSIFQATTLSKANRPKSVSRPVPPANLPFE